MADAPGSSEISAHPLVAKLLDASQGEANVVDLRGFIGPAKDGDDAVTLYTTLELTERFLIPRDAIIHVEEPERDRGNDEPTTVYVKGSAELRLISCEVTTIRADEVSATLWWGVRPPPHMSNPEECGGRMMACIEGSGGSPQNISRCFRNYIRCMDRWNHYVSKVKGG